VRKYIHVFFDGENYEQIKVFRIYEQSSNSVRMSKLRAHFAQIVGRCPQCGSWGSMIEEVVAPEVVAAGKIVVQSGCAAFAAAPPGRD
jgi:hypothetical protein